MPSAGFQIRSMAFAEGARIPRVHTCEGGDKSPPLEWTSPPQGTKSFAVVCDDPDAPAGTWHHWGAYDLSPDIRELPEGARGDTVDFKQTLNDFGRLGYGGPCPPKGHGIHHYRFTIYALDRASLGLGPKAKVQDLVRAVGGRAALAKATLIGLYSR